MKVRDPLPDLFEFSENEDSWSVFEEMLYDFFQRGIEQGQLTFRGQPVNCERRDDVGGKDGAFWHLITEGENEETRVPKLRRCERLRWIPWIINHAGSDNRVRVMSNKRGSDTRFALWLWQKDYAVILAQRKNYYVLKTAYPLYKNRIKQFERDWKRSIKS